MFAHYVDQNALPPDNVFIELLHNVTLKAEIVIHNLSVGNPVTLENIFPHKFLNLHDACYRCRLCPLGEIFDCNNDELPLFYSNWQRANDSDSPLSKGPWRYYSHKVLGRLLSYLGKPFTFVVALNITYDVDLHRWSVVALP